MKIDTASSELAARELAINNLNAALKEYARVLEQQGFKFRQLTEDTDDLLCNIEWRGND